MPPQKNQEVHSHWNIEKWDIDPSKIQSSCKHCSKEYTGNVTHLKKHLGKCRIFLKTAKDKKESQNLLPQSKSATHTRNTQTRINFPRVSKPVPKKELSDAEKKDLDFKAAMWVFEENAPLTFFEDPYAKAFFQELNPLYTLPSAHKIAEILVDHIASQKKSGCTVKVPSRLNIYLKLVRPSEATRSLEHILEDSRDEDDCGGINTTASKPSTSAREPRF